MPGHSADPEAGPVTTQPGSGGFVIAIDGPSGTGKSTVSRRVAELLHAGYLDTGAMYRIVTLHMLRSGVDPDDAAAVADRLAGLEFGSPIDPGRQRHLLAGDDVTARIRDADVTIAVTPVSANPAVRRFLLERQRTLARSGRMVVEGRDIGTVIVPDAPLKIYLTADAGERARRRFRQTVGVRPHGSAEVVGSADSEVEAALAAVAADLHRRDNSDSTRQHAPLQAADDAVVIDSSALGVDETVAAVMELAAARGIS
jgi:cytidylate kinase